MVTGVQTCALPIYTATTEIYTWYDTLSLHDALPISYAQAHGANRGAYSSAEDFAANDVVTHASALGGIAVRLASGQSDPFHPGVRVLASELPHAAVDFSKGCHTGSFFLAQEPPSLAFLSDHLR